MKFNKETMRKRFWEITDEIEKILEESADLKVRAEKVRGILAPIRQDLKDVNAQITKIEEPRLPDMKTELAILARALGTKVGPRPKK